MQARSKTVRSCWFQSLEASNVLPTKALHEAEDLLQQISATPQSSDRLL